MRRQLQIRHHQRAVTAVYDAPENADGAVIFCHGFNGYYTDFGDLARGVNALGLGALRIAFCGGSLRDPSGFGSEHMSLLTEKEDLLAAMAYLRREEGIRHIYLFGASQGGMVCTLTAAACQEEVKGLVLLFPALCIADDWKRMFPDASAMPERLTFMSMPLGRCYRESVEGLDVWRCIAEINKPVLIFHGDADPVVPVSYAQRAVRTFPNANLVVFPGEGHGFTAAGDRRMNALTLDFIAKEYNKKAASHPLI